MLSSCRWFAAIIALALSVHVNAQQQPPPPPPAGAQRFTDATTKLIAAINADDQPAIQQMFDEAMQKALPADKSGPFFRGLLSAKGKLQAAGAPEVSGPAAKVRVTAERGDWRFEIALDPSGKIAGLLVLPGDDKPGRKEAPPAADGVDKFYFDLSKSEDRALKSMAERYINLVKLQEWNDLSGNHRTVAHYVRHEPNLSMVTIEVVKGRGAERTTEQKTVPVDKLSKTCQSRIKQIDTLQKKLQEMAAKAAKDGVAGVPGASPENLGGPMVDERGAEPGAPGPEAGPGSPEMPGPEAVPDPSASEPDPLGFAEVQILPAGPPASESPESPVPAGEIPPGEPAPPSGNR